jgi:hypothetical protein
VFGCEYVEHTVGQIAWDEKDLVVKVNRTEICDASHELVVTPGTLVLPRRNAEIDQFATEMCNIAKILVEDKITGLRVYRYKKLGTGKPDHYRHAMNYCVLAAERTGVLSDNLLIQRFFSKRRGRSWMTA